MSCPTCGAETHQGQRFCMDCGTPIDPATTAATRQVPAVDGSPGAAPTAVIPTVTPAAVGTPLPAAVPIRIIEQTTPLPTVAGTAPPPEQVGGMVWHPMAVDPWPTPHSSPTVVAAPLRPVGLTVLALVTAALGVVAGIVTVGSYRFADGTTGHFTLDDLRSNSFGVMLAATAVLVLGAVVAVAGRRVGAGLAGGGAVAVACTALMDIALVVASLQEARRVGLPTGSVTITWEPGFYVLVAAGAGGLVTAVVALGAWRESGSPVPAAVGVVGCLAVLAMVVGPLVPSGGRSWADNLSIPGFGAVPSWLRLGALAVVGVAGVVAFASRRRWAAGLAVGATAAFAVQWIGALSPPQPNRRGGPGIAITPLDGAAQTIHAGGLLAVVVLGVIGWLLAERRG